MKRYNDAYIGTFQDGNNNYILVASRADSEKTISFDTGIKGGLSVIAGGTATANGTVVSVTIPAHGAVLCIISTHYFAVENNIVSTIKSGETGRFYSTNSTGRNFAALYNSDGRLMHLLLPGMSVTANKDMTVKVFRLNNNLNPISQN